MTLTVSSVALGQIIIPGDNPRQDFDEGKLRSLAKSIQDVGLLEPIVVRPVEENIVELVAGERRFRAVQILEWQEIPAIIREMNDTEAAEARLLENLERENLNPIEEAVAFRQLEDLGHSLKSLAALVHLPQSAIENRLKLLELPTWWEDRVRRGELSAVAAEYLLPWVDRLDIMDAMKAPAKQWPMLLTDWNRRLCAEVMAVSRSMEPDDPDGPRFTPSREQKASLNIRPLRVDSRTTVLRALNCYVWDELQDRSDRDAASVVAKPASETIHLQRADPAVVESGPPEAGGDAEQNLADWFPGWLRKVLLRHLAALPLRELLSLIQRLGVDPLSEWKLERDFLELHSNQELETLADELDVDITEARNRQERLAVFLHAAPEQIPAAVVRLFN